MVALEDKTTARLYSDTILTKQRYELLETFLGPEFVDHYGDVEIRGASGLIRQITAMHAAFDGLVFHIVHMLAEDDIVVIHLEAPGRHVDTFCEVPATGIDVVWRGVMMYRFIAGRIVEGWGYWNTEDVLEQIKEPVLEHESP